MQGLGFRGSVLKGSWDLVPRLIIKATILITSIQVLIAILAKSHDPPSTLVTSMLMC